MKQTRLPILIGFFLTVSIVVVVRVLNAPPSTDKLLARPDMGWARAELQDVMREKIAVEREEIALQKDRIKDKHDAIPTWRYIKYGGAVWLLLSMGAAGLLLATAYRRKLLTHCLEIGGNKVPIKDRDLSKLAPEISTGLVLAAQIEGQAPERAFQMYLNMAEVNSRQIKALTGRALHVHGNALPASQPAALPDDAPTFGALLNSNEIAPKKPLIVGYTASGPKRAALEDNYSTVVIGQSGTGKTSGEAYSIASTMLAYNARYTILDPHYPDAKKESLGDRLGVLTRLPQVTIHNNPLLLDEVVATLDDEFEAYKQTHQGHVPHIIVVDEHGLWKNSSNGGKDLLKLEEKIIYEGRKYEWYLHVTSKSPLAQDFGSSAVRDNFVTSLMYKVRKKQAQTYFQEPNVVDLVQQCTKPGMAVYTDNQEHSQIVRVPEITADDMQTVYQKLANGPEVAVTDSGNASGNVTGLSRSVTTDGNGVKTPLVTGNNSPVTRLRARAQKRGFSQSRTAREMNMNKGYLNQILKGKPPSPDAVAKISEWLRKHDETENVIHFPQIH